MDQDCKGKGGDALDLRRGGDTPVQPNAQGSASAPVEVEGAYMPVPKGVLSTGNIPSSDANRFYHCTFIPLNFSLSSILKGNTHRHTKFCISDSASLFSGCANSPPSFVFFI